MASATIVAGLVSSTIDGVNYDAKSSIKYSPSGVSREVSAVQSGRVVYVEKPEVGTVTVTIQDDGTIDLDVIQAMTDVSAVFSLANGKNVVVQAGVSQGRPEVDTENGTFELTLSGYVTEEG